MFHRYKINPHERGLLFKDGDLVTVLGPGAHWYLDPLMKLRLHVVSPRVNPWLVHPSLDLIARSGELGSEATVIDLNDHQRGLVWIDKRFARLLAPGLYVLWNVEHEVRVEIVNARSMQLVHADLPVIMKGSGASELLEIVNVEAGRNGVWFRDGAYQATLAPGAWVFWKGAGRLKVIDVDLREQTLDISGQEIMTADKVTLRLNALVVYRVTDPLRSVAEVDGAGQALYRAAQLALREIVGARELDVLLVSKEALATELSELTKARAGELGLTVLSTGIRDVILPGDMKDLMNKVMEARKAAEASLISRREETASMRMQANTAKILESNPTLMKLKELEVLEKVADKANLTVLLGGESGLNERVMKLL
jgi:regulator of protease activity HflC (stomatin/prohibitin superfamily)